MTPTPTAANRPGPDTNTAAPGQVRHLSAGQHGIAMQQQRAGDSPIFNVPAAIEIIGDLDIASLRRGLSELIRRHDVLRSRLVHDGPAFAQVVDEPQPALMTVHDLQDLPQQQRENAAHALLDREAARPFDLYTEHGLRLVLVILAPRRHVFFWTMHHLYCDGWSKSVFARDLSFLYAGRDTQLPALDADYGDFVMAQAQADAATEQDHLAYWQRQLAGIATLPGLRHDHPAVPAPQPRGAEVPLRIPATDRVRIEALARTRRATTFMVLQAALVALMHHASGQPDIVISVPYGGRPAAAFEPLIGFFVNVLALRSRVAGAMTFENLMDQVRDTALDGYEHHAVPFQRVVERVGGAAVLQQTSLAFANLPYQDIVLPGAEIRAFPVTRVDIRYELEWHVWEDDCSGGLGGRLIYRSDLFDESSATALATAYQQLLAAAANDAGRRIADLAAMLPVSAASLGHQDVLSGAAAGDVPAPPRTPTEEAVHDIWVDLLHRDEIGVFEDFFDAGGNSLLLAFLSARIREDLDAELTIQHLVGHPTIAAIAAAIDGAGTGERDTSAR
ncbi:Phosphopantetheine attachment site [Asanoa hainanensis]|uniref:Phosphopantetheine attachment site n=1 Tax=Asanoa hainanensis TaxID=560556 RepID=A0A239PGF9_9ACTN|nr:condensation domain-containing protein [Asanoa hainanensis]SNT65895.1 Phosphopantetheine attachment site [Asanoa hainanensis]